MGAWDQMEGLRTMESIQLLAQNRVTRRDYIAAQAFDAFISISENNFWGITDDCARESIAKRCYEWADAFEKARNKR